MKSNNGSLTFALMNMLHNTWNYSEEDRDTWLGRAGDGMGDKEQRKAKMGENSKLVPLHFLLNYFMCPIWRLFSARDVQYYRQDFQSCK